MNTSLEIYRASIGIFNANKKFSRLDRNCLNLLKNAFFEITFALSFIIIFCAVILKNIGLKIACSTNISSSIFTVFSVKFLFNYSEMDELCPHLIILIVVENLFKFHTIYAKNIIFDCLILFTIKSAKFLSICGDVETNPGDTFVFCLWNCNSLPAHNFERISLIENYISIHKVKMFALTETALSSKTDDSAIEIPGFSILRNDLSGDHTYGGVLI